jgi:cell division protein ZapA
MSGRTAQVRVGGQTYRVVTSASDEELKRLAGIVDRKISAVSPPGRPVTPQTMLLAAMALAHELEAERSRAGAIASSARRGFGRLLSRVNEALGQRGGPVSDASPTVDETASWSAAVRRQPANE